MATLLELNAGGRLLKLDPALDHDQQEFRILYASPRLAKWLQETLPTLGSSWNIELSPAEQLDAFMAIYASGQTLTYPRAFHPIRHAGNGVWMLKTADLRVFGWFHARDCFVGHVANTAEKIKQHGLYHGHAGEVVHFRTTLDLNEPKFISGENPNDVVSNFGLPE
jgi:hypothetical protein